MHILFVCTANINRSFMAEVIFKERLKRYGRHDVTVSSAGLVDMKGEPADPIAAEILMESGFDETDHRSAVLTDDSVAGADLIVVMEENQRRLIAKAYPEAEVKIHLLKSYTKGYKGTDSDIKDPYRMSTYHYRLCVSEIYLAVEGLLRSLEEGDA
jgi:protein-tyrosine phosphatase